MAATAIPAYNTYRQRTIGSEAQVMLKQILDAEIMYFLEHDKFFPEGGSSMSIFHDDAPNKQEILDIKNAFNILIPVGHSLDYNIQTLSRRGDNDFCIVVISAFFPLFGDGSKQIGAIVDKTGTVTTF